MLLTDLHGEALRLPLLSEVGPVLRSILFTQSQEPRTPPHHQQSPHAQRAPSPSQTQPHSQRKSKHLSSIQATNVRDLKDVRDVKNPKGAKGAKSAKSAKSAKGRRHAHDSQDFPSTVDSSLNSLQPFASSDTDIESHSYHHPTNQPRSQFEASESVVTIIQDDRTCFDAAAASAFHNSISTDEFKTARHMPSPRSTKKASVTKSASFTSLSTKPYELSSSLINSSRVSSCSQLAPTIHTLSTSQRKAFQERYEQQYARLQMLEREIESLRLQTMRTRLQQQGRLVRFLRGAAILSNSVLGLWLFALRTTHAVRHQIQMRNLVVNLISRSMTNKSPLSIPKILASALWKGSAAASFSILSTILLVVGGPRATHSALVLSIASSIFMAFRLQWVPWSNYLNVFVLLLYFMTEQYQSLPSIQGFPLL